MSVHEAKNLLHKLIVETDDLSVLSQVADFFNLVKTKHSDWWDTISDEEKALIENGIQQMKAGEGIEHQEVRKNIDQILNKKRA